MKTVAFVPIKLNSQRLPNKNILNLNERPLCWYIFDTLSKVKNIDEIYVFCSDERIKNFIPDNIIYLKRDKKLDQNETKGFEIYESFIRQIKADIYILAHTTSPFVKTDSIENALENVLKNSYDSAFSSQKIKTFAWYNNKTINYDVKDVPRTQDISPIYIETSGFYIFKSEIFKKHNRRIGYKPYISELDSYESLDIDTKEDYEIAKIYAKKVIKEKNNV